MNEMEESICCNCGKEFTPGTNDSLKYEKHGVTWYFCSKTCYNLFKGFGIEKIRSG